MHHLELAVRVCIFGIEAQAYQNRHSGLLAAAQRKLHLDQLAVGGLFGGDVLGGVGGGAVGCTKGCLAARGDGKAGQGGLVAPITLVQLGGNRHLVSRFVQYGQKGRIAQMSALQIVLLFGGELAGKGQLGNIRRGTGLQSAVFTGGFADGSSKSAQLIGDALLAVSRSNGIYKFYAHRGSALAVVGVSGVHGDFIAGSAGVRAQLGVPCFPAELGALGQALGLQADMAEGLAAVNAGGVLSQLGYDPGALGQGVTGRLDLIGKLHAAAVVALAGHGYFIRTGVGAGFGILHGIVGAFGQITALGHRNGGLLFAAGISEFSAAQRKVIRHKALGRNAEIGRGRAFGGVCGCGKAGGHGVAAHLGGGRGAFGIGGAVSACVGVAYLIDAVGGTFGHRGGGGFTIGVICHAHAAAALGLADRVRIFHAAGVVALAGHGERIVTGVGAFRGGHFVIAVLQSGRTHGRLLHLAVISKLGGAQRKVLFRKALGGNAEIGCGRAGLMGGGFGKASGHGVAAHLGGGCGALGIGGAISASVGAAHLTGAVLRLRGNGLAVNIAFVHGHAAAALGLLNGQGSGDAVQHTGAVFVSGAFKIHANGVFTGHGGGFGAPLAAALLIAQRKRALGIGFVQNIVVHRGQGVRLLVNSGDRTAKAAAGFHGGQRACKDRKFAGAAGKGAACIVALAGERVGNFRVAVFSAGAAMGVGYFVIRSCGQRVSVGILQSQFVGIQPLLLSVIAAGNEILLHRHFAGVGRNAALGRAGIRA